MLIAQVGTVDTLAEILAIGNTTGATDIAVDSAQKVQFRDAAIYINSSVDGQLDIVADTEIQIAATTVDLNGNLDVSGTLGVTGVLTATSLDISGDIDVDGTTNLDVVDIDGAVDMASTLLVTGVLTTTAATVSNGGGQFNGAINVGVKTTGKSLLWDESLAMTLSSLALLLELTCFGMSRQMI
jgi:cytoskeletal protein CcmA (bactofilin family)